jgi:glucose-6-phosphate 1-dehydrogenase
MTTPLTPSTTPLIRPTTLVLFGATGDLCRRKLLPALHHLRVAGLLPDRTRIVATSPDDITPAQFAALARRAIAEHSPWGEDDGGLPAVTYVRTNSSMGGLSPLADAVVSGEGHPIFYLAVPPHAFAGLTQQLVVSTLAEGARIVYEKPFGETRRAFDELSTLVGALLDEGQVHCVDHYLAKDAVRQIIRARFAGPLFDGVWDRERIERVEIDVPETLGVGTRGAFYDRTGALKDMVMTHLLNVLAVVAMERPASWRPNDVADARAEVLRAVASLDARSVVRGQYDGFRGIVDVRPDSDTETFVAARIRVDNARWGGVPFLLRTGKRLGSDRQRVRVVFHAPVPVLAGDGPRGRRHARAVSFDLRAAQTVDLLGGRRGPWPVGAGPALPPLGAYERLLLELMEGPRASVVRADAIAETWRIVGDILDAPPPLSRYAVGSSGPSAAARLLAARPRLVREARRGQVGAGCEIEGARATIARGGRLRARARPRRG